MGRMGMSRKELRRVGVRERVKRKDPKGVAPLGVGVRIPPSAPKLGLGDLNGRGQAVAMNVPLGILVSLQDLL